EIDGELLVDLNLDDRADLFLKACQLGVHLIISGRQERNIVVSGFIGYRGACYASLDVAHRDTHAWQNCIGCVAHDSPDRSCNRLAPGLPNRQAKTEHDDKPSAPT